MVVEARREPGGTGLGGADRIDIVVTPSHVVVTRFWRVGGHLAAPHGAEVKPGGFDVEAALAAYEENGYTVRRWQGGARAWKGDPQPVRTAAQIRARRARAERQARWRGLAGCSLSRDFAYDD